jgi:hypothetical protein
MTGSPRPAARSPFGEACLKQRAGLDRLTFRQTPEIAAISSVIPDPLPSRMPDTFARDRGGQAKAGRKALPRGKFRRRGVAMAPAQKGPLKLDVNF